MTMDELFKRYVDDYLSLKPSSSSKKLNSWYKINIKPRIGKRKITSLKLTDLELLAKEMLKEEYSINYINKMTTNIKTILNYGVSHGFIEKNPVAGYKSLKKVNTTKNIQYWTPKQFKKVIDSIDQLYNNKNTDNNYIRLMLMFGYLSGARKGEIRALKWEDIEIYEDSGIIHIDHHINEENQRIKGRKNGDGYTLHMDPSLLALTKEIYSYFSRFDGFNPNGYVFPSIMNGFDTPIGGHTPTRWVQQLAEFNNLKNITFHGLRHSLVCYLATEVKLTPYEVADRIGDTVQVVMQHYYQFFQESRIEVAKTIGEYKNEYFDSMLMKKEKNE